MSPFGRREAFGLERCESPASVKCYVRDRFRLVVSGIGKVASATAVGYIAGSEPDDANFAWVNVGIAGHACLPNDS